MALSKLVSYVGVAAVLLTRVSAQGASGTEGVSSTLVSTGANAQFTIPFDVDNGANLQPTVFDSAAPQPQNACPGYKASNVQQTQNGLTASLSLAGPAVRLLLPPTYT